jgi:uncharacterized repeat protein (TIGR01451 family)
MHAHTKMALLALLLVGLLPAAGAAQHPIHLPPPPLIGPAPLLYIRLLGPEGLRVTFYQGTVSPRTVAVPATVGLRPGYVYRMKVSGFPGLPGATLFPSLEVRGSLRLPHQFNAADHPAPVAISNEDVTHVSGGAVLTRVVVLEHPDRATALATRADEPLVVPLPPGQDPLVEARERGRPVLVVRVGQRNFTPEELACEGVPGTILLPGDRGLGPPACRPWVPWDCVPCYDPLAGPGLPEEECLHDGGDVGEPAGLDRNGQLHGLDPSDTVAEYSDCQGRRRLAVSNRVCICVPRFLVVAGEIVVAGFSGHQEIANTIALQSQERLQFRVPSKQTRQTERLSDLRGRERLSGTASSQGLGRLAHLVVLNAYQIEIGPGALLGTERMHQLTQEQRLLLRKQMEFALRLSESTGPAGVDQVFLGPAAVGRIQGVNVISTLQGARDVTVACDEKPVPPDRPLHLHKWADRHAAQIGDVVTFFLKYSNHGGQPITDVAVSDSLTGRLEYVAGSAQSDRDAVFTMQQNEAGSAILHWEIGGPLLPGQSGVVRFQARVR